MLWVLTSTCAVIVRHCCVYRMDTLISSAQIANGVLTSHVLPPHGMLQHAHTAVPHLQQPSPGGSVRRVSDACVMHFSPPVSLHLLSHLWTVMTLA